MRDLAHNIGVVLAAPPATRTATFTGDPIDLLGFESAALLVNVGAISAAGSMTAKLQHSDTTTSGDFVDVPAAELVGALPAVLVAASAVKQGYIGTKRYLRTVLTFNGGTSVSLGAVLVKGHPANAPVT